jgi:hypothetical protein
MGQRDIQDTHWASRGNISGNIVDFPGLSSPEGYSAEHVDEVHARSFRILHLCAFVNISEIAAS